VIGIKSNTGSAADPIQIDNNYFGTATGDGGLGYVITQFRAATDYVSMSNNELNARYIFFSSNAFTTLSSQSIRINGNKGICAALYMTLNGGGIGNLMPNMQIKNNQLASYARATGIGASDRTMNVPQGTPGNPVVVSGNTFLSSFRLCGYGSHLRFEDNMCGWANHHGMHATTETNRALKDIKVRRNVFFGVGVYDASPWLETGTNKDVWIDDVEYSNNTVVAGSGGFGIGDITDVTQTNLVTNYRVFNNLIVGAVVAGVKRATNLVGRRTLAHIPQMENNFYNAVSTTYSGMNRGGSFRIGGVLYANGTRNINGVALYDPTYATDQPGRDLVFTYNSPTDRTLSWGGGAPVQLIYGSFTASAAANDIANLSTYFGTIDITGGAWTTNLTLDTTPRGHWILITSGAGAGQIRAVVLNTASKLTVAPTWDTVPQAGDSFVIFRAEVLLPDAGGGSVRAGIDLRGMPTSTQTDAAITFTLTETIGIDPQFVGGTNYDTPVRASYVPQNALLATAGVGGTYVGALAPVLPPPPIEARQTSTMAVAISIGF
jgi:hypothetical protein